MVNYYEFLLFLHRIKVFKALTIAKNEKGTSVKNRDYTRSCEFLDAPCILNDHCLWVGRSRGGNKSEDLPFSFLKAVYKQFHRCFRE